MNAYKKRILIIGQTPPPFGGQAINIEKIIRTLEKNRVNYRFVRLHFSEQLNDIGKFNFTKLIRLFTTWLQIMYYLISYRPQLVYYPPAGPTRNAILRDIVLLFPIRLFRCKTVFHFHAAGLSDIYESLSPLVQFFYRFVYRHATHAICLSNAGKKDPLALGIRQIHIIPSGVEDLLKDTSTEKDKDFTVFFAGLCSESKGILDFIEAIRICRQSNTRIKGRVIGKIFSDKEADAITKAVAEGVLLYDGVQTGKEKQKAFAAAAVFLFPTFFESESFPTVILEAFAAKLPVIATNWRGIPDQVTNGYNGYVVPLHDTQAMARHILELANNTALYEQLSANARLDFETRYTMSTFEASILSFFKSNS